MTNKKLAIHIEKKLLEFTNDPVFQLEEYENYILFDYPKYFDGYPRFQNDIEKEFNFLLGFKKFLQNNNYKGFYFIADAAIKIN